MRAPGRALGSVPGESTAPATISVQVNGVPVRVELPPPAIEALRRVLVADGPGRPPPATPYVTPAEAGELLGYGANPERGRRRVYELVGDGRLTRHDPGRRLLVSRAEVEKLASGAVTSR